MDEWHTKYNSIEKKLQELRLKYSTIKNDFNKQNRIIAREIGEDFNIDDVK